jgi:putative spermidine/putrescine transport system ATP-binding protein
MRREIRRIVKEGGLTAIYVTHDQEEALSLSDRVVVMSNGRIEQIGTPFEVYNFPTTRFVASFVGTLNVLSADVADGGGKIRIDGQDIQAAQAVADTLTGRSITVALRPEVLSLNGHDAPGAINHLTGTVDDVMFLGPTMRVRVRLKNQSFQFDEFNNPQVPPPQQGQQVTVSFPPEACLLLTDQ